MGTNDSQVHHCISESLQREQAGGAAGAHQVRPEFHGLRKGKQQQGEGTSQVWSLLIIIHKHHKSVLSRPAAGAGSTGPAGVTNSTACTAGKRNDAMRTAMTFKGKRLTYWREECFNILASCPIRVSFHVHGEVVEIVQAGASLLAHTARASMGQPCLSAVETNVRTNNWSRHGESRGSLWQKTKGTRNSGGLLAKCFWWTVFPSKQ